MDNILFNTIIKRLKNLPKSGVFIGIFGIQIKLFSFPIFTVDFNGFGYSPKKDIKTKKAQKIVEPLSAKFSLYEKIMILQGFFIFIEPTICLLMKNI